MTTLDNRNLKIIEALRTGNNTLQQIADNNNLSRERVRQIYHKLTHQGFSVRGTKAMMDKLHAVAFRCSACQKEVERIDARNKISLCPEFSYRQRNNFILSHK